MSADPHTLSQKHLFCFGHGYCCDYLGHELIEKEGWKISGTTRDPDKKNILRERGIRPFTFDETHPLADPLYILRDVTHILISTPPAEEGDPTFVMHAADICQLPGIEWIGYLSTTGAYGGPRRRMGGRDVRSAADDDPRDAPCAGGGAMAFTS
jgi:hypothetical protein